MLPFKNCDAFQTPLILKNNENKGDLGPCLAPIRGSNPCWPYSKPNGENLTFTKPNLTKNKHQQLRKKTFQPLFSIFIKDKEGGGWSDRQAKYRIPPLEVIYIYVLLNINFCAVSTRE